jgi:sugar phosphate isomerase/epimerase
MKPDHSWNRRAFLKSTAIASAAATLMPASLTVAAPDRIGPWKFCAFEKPLLFLNYDETAEVFAELGFDGLEAAVRPGGHVLPERVEEDLPKFVEALKQRGLEITVLASGISSATQPHTEKVLRTAAKLGIKRYRMDWWRYDLKQPIQPQLDALRPRLKELAALNRSLGVTGLYQNHAGANMVGAAVWDIYGLVREFDPKDVALAFDIRHATVEGGLSWPVQFNLVKSHIGAAYFKDFVWDQDKVKNVPLGAGRVDRKYAPLLKASGFVGPMSVHVEYGEGSKDRAYFAEAFRKDLATLRTWLKSA